MWRPCFPGLRGERRGSQYALARAECHRKARAGHDRRPSRHGLHPAELSIARRVRGHHRSVRRVRLRGLRLQQKHPRHGTAVSDRQRPGRAALRASAPARGGCHRVSPLIVWAKGHHARRTCWPLDSLGCEPVLPRLQVRVRRLLPAAPRRRLRRRPGDSQLQDDDDIPQLGLWGRAHKLLHGGPAPLPRARGAEPGVRPEAEAR
mmetsp:Transcript_51528/g.115950  ORF Transcript_51528/g.115950 Transcript_51528/m.115950 type:complete len:205 (-) Transcript_51528:236-850(-)